ncbi:N-acyl-D-amino-acid deacylase family protein [Cellulosimicrobium cellulans]|uniref:N-acyl-D-aspartate/D-glutamate deacylase n=1 Tax=Cellulosimicrobium cellulans TaxID=1710 RepID=A0A4Y4E4V0_CELCE|nr:amidohydrolase family protein [Cellulosimicrobium cellulans]GED09711.1 N-acyl-D-aspartate/D-glutamate deacylase [Cellulosimicrobium cellulans]
MSALVVRGARLVEPDGGASSPVDVTVRGGRVERVATAAGAGALPDDAAFVEADGRLLVPGFVDAHVHGEAAVLDEDVQLAMLRQGVTSVVVGQDGVSYAPSPAPGETRTGSDGTASGLHDAAAWASGYFAAINGEHPTFRGGSVADLLATYDRTTRVNVGYLAPHGTIRYAVLGAAARAATPAETDRMRALLSAALDDGALGMSTGLEYVPATSADEAELVALTSVLAARGLPHVSHMRGYEDKAGPAFAELVRVARASGVATHVSHYHGPAAELLGYVDDAHAQGLDVTFDSYPYLRGCSILSMVSLPTWLPIADVDATVAALTDPAVLDCLHLEHFPALTDLWPRVTLAAVPTGTAAGAPHGGTADDLTWAEGRTLPDVAARLGMTPAQAAVHLLVATRLRASCVFAQPPTNSPESVRALLRHRAHVGGSDAIYAPVGGGGRPHPRGWGAFARFLAEHVRTLGDWTWHDAVTHLSTRPAERFALAGRGVVAPGAVADLALVDPDRVRDEATYEDPRRPASGVDDVLVAGVPVLRDGSLTDALPGRPLRPGVPTA